LKGRDHLGKPRHCWKDSIKMDLKEIRKEGVDWIHQVQGRNKWWTDVNME
jgi:hypothetical protein